VELMRADVNPMPVSAGLLSGAVNGIHGAREYVTACRLATAGTSRARASVFSQRRDYTVGPT
jgi:hypothetical protein